MQDFIRFPVLRFVNELHHEQASSGFSMTPFFILLMGISTIFSSETHKYFVRSPILFAPFHTVFFANGLHNKKLFQKTGVFLHCHFLIPKIVEYGPSFGG